MSIKQHESSTHLEKQLVPQNVGETEMSSATYNFIKPVRFSTECTWQTQHKPLLSSLLLSKSGISWDLESADTDVTKDFL